MERKEDRKEKRKEKRRGDSRKRMGEYVRGGGSKQVQPGNIHRENHIPRQDIIKVVAKPRLVCQPCTAHLVGK